MRYLIRVAGVLAAAMFVLALVVPMPRWVQPLWPLAVLGWICAASRWQQLLARWKRAYECELLFVHQLLGVVDAEETETSASSE